VPDKNLPSGQPAESPDGSKSRMAKGKFNPINMATLVFFADASAELDQEARDRLLRLLPWIAGKPQKIEIRGHASRRPLPPDSRFTDAWQLCYARCRATVDFLVENGIPPERLRISQAAGYEPYTERVDPQWQARNSRVEVALLSELTAEAGIADSPTSATASNTEPSHP
jgi:chemotaxis protein MotB